MIPSPALDPERWLQERNSVIDDLFAQATNSLQAAGIRVLTGSHPPQPEYAKNSPCIRLKPVRFLNSNNEAAVELNISASTSGGPPRYVVTIAIRGTQAIQALCHLSLSNAGCWQRMFVGRGLWITDTRGTHPFNDLSTISEDASQWVTLSAVFLHSERSRAIQEGIMVMGLLYRSLLDELSGTSKMGNLAAVLTECLDGNPPQFQRTVCIVARGWVGGYEGMPVKVILEVTIRRGMVILSAAKDLSSQQHHAGIPALFSYCQLLTVSCGLFYGMTAVASRPSAKDHTIDYHEFTIMSIPK